MSEGGGAPASSGGGRGGKGGGRGRGNKGGGRGGKGGRGGDGGGGRGGGKSNNNEKPPNKGGRGGGAKAGAEGGGRGGGGGGRGNKNNRRRNNNAKGKDSQEQAAPKISEEERLRQEEERKQQEAAEAERKRIEEEQKAALKLQEERQKAKEALEARYMEAIEVVKGVVESTQAHVRSREALAPEALKQARADFTASKKNLKSDLKKCTAFVKKVKSGTAWSMRPDDITKDVATLNLSRYVEEVVSALLEAKLKLTDIPVVIALCTAMHTRYPEFLSNLLPGLWGVIQAKPTEETSKLRRIYVRLITEFLLHGLISSEPKQLIKLIAEVTGAKDGSFAVTDALIVVAFAKSAGLETLGITPTAVRTSTELMLSQKELIQQSSEEASNNSNGPVVVSDGLAKKGNALLEQFDALKDQRAVPEEVATNFVTCCKGAYDTLSKSLVETHNKLQKMEKRFEQDRLLSGTLPEAREKSLADAKKLHESLTKSVEAISEALDLSMPQLEDEKHDDDEGAGPGLELWTKGGEEGEDFGPFDDEETRAFYSDLPDLLTTVPPALLNLSPEEIEKRKADNAAKFGNDFESLPEDVESEVTEVEGSSEAQLEADEQDEGAAKDEERPEDTEEGNQDTPHFKLMTLLEQELPECNRREQIDEIAEKFCTNHGSSKNSRKRLQETLFHVPRTRLDLLPFYSRLASTLGRVWPEVSDALVTSLEQQFHGQAKFKKNQNIESRLRTARYIGELTKFRTAPPMIAFRCIRRCLDDFTGGNVDVACCVLESCGRYLYRLPHTNPKLTSLMDAMMRIGKSKRLDERSTALMNTAFYTVKPPPSGPRKQAKVYPPLEGYLRYLLMVKMQPSESSISNVAKQLIRFPWNDPSQQCGPLVCRIMLKTCRNGRYKAIHAVAEVAAKLRRQKPEVSVRLLDLVLEELRWNLEHPAFKDQQRTITYARLLGELYCASIASGPLIMQQLYFFINLGHEIPEALRKASEKQKAEGMKQGEDTTPVYNSATGVSSTIQEDEEMDDDNLEAKEEKPIPPQPVAVSDKSKYDPRVPSALDPPNSAFRIKLVCALLEVVAKSIVTRSNLPKMEAFLAAFQRYLFTKTMLPTDVEFSLLDTFDIIDSQWKIVSKETKAKGKSGEDVEGFPRFFSWIEAHNATVAFEEADAVFDERSRSRLESVVGSVKGDGEDTMMSDGTQDDDDEDDETMGGSDDDSLSVSAKDSVIDDDESMGASVEGEGENKANESGSGSDGLEDEDESDDDEDSDDEDSEEEFDEKAYMQQLEDEAFERELRRLTMDALDKGKATSRGGKVSEHMPTGSQFIKKKSAEPTTEPGPSLALTGKSGISFQLLKKGNKGKLEAKQFVVPSDTNLAHIATKQDGEAARERDMIKARVLQYEAESADAGDGNVYLEQSKLQVIKNRLSMDVIDRNFGTTGGNLRTNDDKPKPTNPGRGQSGPGGRGSAGGRGRGFSGGRGGRGGRGNASGRTLI